MNFTCLYQCDKTWQVCLELCMNQYNSNYQLQNPLGQSIELIGAHLLQLISQVISLNSVRTIKAMIGKQR